MYLILIDFRTLYKRDDSSIFGVIVAWPYEYVTSFNGYIINRYKFHVQEYDKSLITENFGMVIVGETDEKNKILITMDN